MAFTETELRQLKAQQDGRVTHLYEYTYSDGHKEYRASFNNGGLSEEISKKQYDQYSKFMVNCNEFITLINNQDYNMTAFWAYKEGGNGLPNWFNYFFN